MKILFVIDNLEFGGGERGFLQIIKGLYKGKYTIHVASNPGGEFWIKLMEMGIKYFCSFFPYLGLAVPSLNNPVEQWEWLNYEAVNKDFWI